MEELKKIKLQSQGWIVGDVKDFLQLTPAEEAIIEIKLHLARLLQTKRKEQGLTQAQVAQRLASSQSRVAKMEHADASVSLDLLVRSLLELGISRQELGAALAQL